MRKRKKEIERKKKIKRKRKQLRRENEEKKEREVLRQEEKREKGKGRIESRRKESLYKNGTRLIQYERTRKKVKFLINKYSELFSRIEFGFSEEYKRSLEKIKWKGMKE